MATRPRRAGAAPEVNADTGCAHRPNQPSIWRRRVATWVLRNHVAAVRWRRGRDSVETRPAEPRTVPDENHQQLSLYRAHQVMPEMITLPSYQRPQRSAAPAVDVDRRPPPARVR